MFCLKLAVVCIILRFLIVGADVAFLEVKAKEGFQNHGFERINSLAIIWITSSKQILSLIFLYSKVFHQCNLTADFLISFNCSCTEFFQSAVLFGFPFLTIISIYLFFSNQIQCLHLCNMKMMIKGTCNVIIQIVI